MSSGGGVRDLGTVTGGMAMMNVDENNRPYTRQDMVDFLMHYDTNLNDSEMRLLEKGMAATFVGMPLAAFLGYRVSARFAWHRVEKVVPYRWISTAGKWTFAMASATLPYMAVQQWFVSSVLALDNNSNLSFHVKRMMLSQRNGLMFQRTATREVTREEQDRLGREAQDHVLANRMAARPENGGKVDVNLQLGQQVLTPIAQSGYKPMPKQ